MRVPTGKLSDQVCHVGVQLFYEYYMKFYMGKFVTYSLLLAVFPRNGVDPTYLYTIPNQRQSND